MAQNIFLSYRRDDERGYAHNLYEHLSEQLPQATIFMDVAGHIELGDEFSKTIETYIKKSDIVIVLIGPKWVDLLHAKRKDGKDYVEWETSLARTEGKRVIPVYVNDAQQLKPADLPNSLKFLAALQSYEIDANNPKRDAIYLAHKLTDLQKTQPTENNENKGERGPNSKIQSKRFALYGLLSLGIIILLLIITLFSEAPKLISDYLYKSCLNHAETMEEKIKCHQKYGGF